MSITIREALEKQGIDIAALLDKEVPVAARGVIVLERIQTSLGAFELVLREAQP